MPNSDYGNQTFYNAKKKPSYGQKKHVMISHDHLAHSDLINNSGLNDSRDGTCTTTAKTQIPALYRTMYGEFKSNGSDIVRTSH